MAQAARRRIIPPEDRDPPVAAGADLSVLDAIKAYKREAEDARKSRLKRNRVNWEAFLGEQDFSHKQPGQSQEMLPKVPMAVEQIAAFVKRALVDFGDWFSLELSDESVLSGDAARRLLRAKLEQGGGASDRDDFATLVADAVKVGLLGSLMVLKIYGRDQAREVFVAERGQTLLTLPDGSVLPQITSALVRKEVTTWQLRIDLISPDDYLPDPTGRGLYEIHSVERDLWEVAEMADAGIYDPKVVDAITEDFHRHDERWTRDRQRGQDSSTPPAFRKRIVIDECWGTLLKPDGRVAERNVICAMANDRYLLRAPEPNPFWHGQRPFVSCPLVRVPFSTWHKALFDHAVSLNFALNELYNLMLDGGIASVWGNKQVRPGYLDDPRQISDGIPPGMTLVVNDTAPPGAKVLEQVATGQVPRESLAMFQLTDTEFQTATQVNAIKLGLTPPRQTTATAIVEAQQQSNTYFDGMIRDVEDKLIEPTLWKAWCCLLQHLDDADAEDVIAAVGERGAMALAQMPPAARYAQFAQGARVKVSGLSAVLARVRDFQKLLGLMQVVSANPMLTQAFMAKYSPQKVLSRFFKTLNIDPETLQPDPEEQAQLEQQRQLLLMQQMQQAGQEGGGAPGVGEAPPNLGPEGGEPELPTMEMPAGPGGIIG